MLEKFEPKDVFYWFEELSKIPRCSRQEKKVSDFLVDFAKKIQLPPKSGQPRLISRGRCGQ